jgi:putative transcriptional regulator
MTPHHHIPEEVLLDYASGALSHPFAVLVATHMALCPRCRDELDLLESVGADMMGDLPEEPCNSDLLASTLARLEVGPASTPTPTRTADRAPTDIRIPQPLRDLIGLPLESLAWKGIGGFRQANLPITLDGVVARLMRIRGGTSMPRHTHGGLELTLVFTGGFSDENGHYLRGDVAAADPAVEHRPIADPGEECLCLAVSEAPPRLTGALGMWLNPFLNS